MPTGAKIKYPANELARVANQRYMRSSNDEGVLGYTVLITILNVFQSILDVVEKREGDSERLIDSAERERFCTAVAARATAFTDLFNSTLSDPSNPLESKPRGGIYLEDVRKSFLSPNHQSVRTDGPSRRFQHHDLHVPEQSSQRRSRASREVHKEGGCLARCRVWISYGSRLLRGNSR